MQKRRFERSTSAAKRTIVAPMKSITPTINGLASSLCLNVGLTKLAEKLDPVATFHGEIMINSTDRSGGVQASTWPSLYTPRPSR